MINQKAMADAFKAAKEKVTSVKVKADGFRDGNGMRAVQNSLKKSLVNAGVAEQAAIRIATQFFHNNIKA